MFEHDTIVSRDQRFFSCFGFVSQESKTNLLRISVSSPIAPPVTLDYNMDSHAETVISRTTTSFDRRNASGWFVVSHSKNGTLKMC
jgi:protease II